MTQDEYAPIQQRHRQISLLTIMLATLSLCLVATPPVQAEEERSREALWAYLGTALRHFSPPECQHSFRHCGYAVT